MVLRFTGNALLVVLLLLCSSEDAFALRCGSKLVKEGMHESRVIDLCGEPVSVTDLGFILRPYIIKRPAGDFGVRSTRRVHTGYHEEVRITEMLFNFGPHRLMRVIRFENGRVASIETAGYGFRPKK